jgi:hypothetical protein
MSGCGGECARACRTSRGAAKPRDKGEQVVGGFSQGVMFAARWGDVRVIRKQVGEVGGHPRVTSVIGPGRCSLFFYFFWKLGHASLKFFFCLHKTIEKA